MESAYSGSGIKGYKVAQHDLGQLDARYYLHGISSGSVAQLVSGVTGYCRVAMVLIRLDFPAPLGPSRPNIPLSTVRETPPSALTPLEYCFRRLSMTNCIRNS